MRANITDKISSVSFKSDLIMITTDRGTYQWKISEISKKLSAASDSDRNNFKISPSGYGIHWPSIDEDLSIRGLIALGR